jgi:hypothetical protein
VHGSIGLTILTDVTLMEDRLWKPQGFFGSWPDARVLTAGLSAARAIRSRHDRCRNSPAPRLGCFHTPLFGLANRMKNKRPRLFLILLPAIPYSVSFFLSRDFEKGFIGDGLGLFLAGMFGLGARFLDPQFDRQVPAGMAWLPLYWLANPFLWGGVRLLQVGRRQAATICGVFATIIALAGAIDWSGHGNHFIDWPCWYPWTLAMAMLVVACRLAPSFPSDRPLGTRQPRSDRPDSLPWRIPLVITACYAVAIIGCYSIRLSSQGPVTRVQAMRVSEGSILNILRITAVEILDHSGRSILMISFCFFAGMWLAFITRSALYFLWRCLNIGSR